jgi:hypothetical protein
LGDPTPTPGEVQRLAESRGYNLVNQGGGYWLVHRATAIPELNDRTGTLTFSLNEAWLFLKNLPVG